MQENLKKHFYNEFKKYRHLKLEEVNTETHDIISLNKYISYGKYFLLTEEGKLREQALVDYLIGQDIKLVAVPIVENESLVFIKSNL
ncbi:hypothetical protein [Campylobacter sp. RM16190]|uniref:hypothetical protein n=1 Tax=Campylobacter sp. RM16190 TaxID=1705727 RepID=UPI001472D4B0|nr:hypothetical protein [Campylobacter sp. RM16190]